MNDRNAEKPGPTRLKAFFQGATVGTTSVGALMFMLALSIGFLGEHNLEELTKPVNSIPDPIADITITSALCLTGIFLGSRPFQSSRRFWGTFAAGAAITTSAIWAIEMYRWQ